MGEIKINLQKLAKECISLFSFNCNGEIYADDPMQELTQHVEEYVGNRTEVGKIIKEPALSHLLEDLFIWIKQELYIELHKQYLALDSEDKEVLKNKMHLYEDEQDGD